MPNHKSAWKRVKQDKVKQARNSAYKSVMKTAGKKVLVAVAGGDKEEAEKTLLSAIKIIDKICSKGVIHKNNRSRKISRLTLKVNSMTAASA